MGLDDLSEQLETSTTAVSAATPGRIRIFYFTGSGNAKTGSTSIGTSPARERASFKSAGILSYFANHASVRARSPVASCSSSSFASAASAGARYRIDYTNIAPARAMAPRSVRTLNSIISARPCASPVPNRTVRKIPATYDA